MQINLVLRVTKQDTIILPLICDLNFARLNHTQLFMAAITSKSYPL